MKIPQFLSRIPFRKTIAATLVMMILVSQTIHVDFFDTAQAGPQNYRDIVSIIVDRETYASERNRILQYASDIAGYLGGVRTSILVVEKDTPVATIAQKNEKLYYEGDGDPGTSSLVGTVLIGNIPIPLVTKDGVNFASLYPYVDFSDKAFVYDAKSSRYIYNTTDVVSESVEIWHGVINPAVGRNWGGSSDIAKIGQFLDKTHAFYTKSGKFAPSTVPPKVLYYDGLSESKSIDSRGLFQYSLSMKNAENIAYSRFTKYLLRDISTSLKGFDAQKSDPEISALYASLGIPEGSDTLSEDQIKKLPDIQSKEVILGFLKNFKGIFNEKTLGAELLSVHNAGRYTSGSNVRADIMPISISLMDDIARSTLKTSNDALTTSIDQSLESGIASKIVLFDKSMQPSQREYKNYYFGVPSETISSPSQCTIARGFSGDTAQFGRSVLVEANAAFDISSTEGHINLLKQDTDRMVALHRNAAYSCFDPTTSKAKLASYWGDNSILKIAGNVSLGSSSDSFLFEASPATKFTGFSLPIFTLGGMKESSRISNPSIANCIAPTYQYTLLQPFLRTYTEDNGYNSSQTYTVAWPDEWNVRGIYNGSTVPRFTCNTTHQVDVTVPLEKSMREYSTRTCFAGSIFLNGQVLKVANNICIQTMGGGDSTYEVDNTFYEDRYYHTIPSIWSHASPTNAEISAAKINGITPSLAIDQIRYVEFLTPKGNIARLNYPNFFELEGNTIASVRNWITKTSANEWKKVIDTENTTILSPERSSVNQRIPPGILPISPPDWNIYLSDSMIEKIIQAKNWLHPDISIKYKKALESMLSYSHVNTSVTPLVETAPAIPSTTEEYEIAYLGLPPAFDADFSQRSSSTAQAGYDTRIREIEGANISDESQSGMSVNTNPATQCGPPDGVPLLQWPSAIICWIKAQFPPRILAGSCGPSTIGLSSPNTSAPQGPSLAISTNTTALNAFYVGARVIPHLPRSSLQLHDTIAIDTSLQKNNSTLSVLPDTVARLEIISGTTGGKVIGPSALGEYLNIAPSQSMVGEKGAQFLIESTGKESTLKLRAYYTIPLPDGSEILLNSQDFQVQVTPEYYSILLEQSGSSVVSIDVTAPDPTRLRIQKILKNGESTPTIPPMTIVVIDDVSGEVVYTGSNFNPVTDALPNSITKKIGVYRLLIRDSIGISGELTFLVQSGILSQVRIVPISSALVKGTSTLAMVRLLDRLGNPVSANLHTLKLDITGGYMVDASGDKKSSMSMDIIESQVPIVIGSDSPGSLTLRASVDDLVVGHKDMVIYNSARIALMRSTAPQVGGKPIAVHIEIQDEAGKRISGLSSVASWKLPGGAGTFSKETIAITDGLSENFDYLPGSVSGNHALSIDVPGVGSLSNIVFSLLPGDPLYISHVKDTNSIIFSLRDRYDNIASFSSLVGTLSHNNGSATPIAFSNGEYRTPLKGGEYTIIVPGLKDNNITYTDDVGTHSISGMDMYTASISGNQEVIDFAPDYNARYTVLAGGSFLREGEDILYNTTPGKSQSLAVSTVLESPYRQDILMSLLPGGSYSMNHTSYDSSLQSSISLLGGFPLLTVSDIVTHKQIARVLYPMNGVLFETCQGSSSLACAPFKKQPTIRLITPSTSDITMSIASGVMRVVSPSISILTISNNGVIDANPAVSFIPKDTSTSGFEMGIMLDGKEVGSLVYSMDLTLSVARAISENELTSKNTPVILSSGFSIEKIPGNPLVPETMGYQIFRLTSSQELDETKNGPAHTDSIGALSEVPGVGWTGNNTMLLAYAGGDSVGETTKFFHTYTLINLGDPVTHVDHGVPGTEKDGIDRTLGSIIARGTKSGIENVFHRDMNADGLLDLIVVYQDGFIELFLNQGNRFRSRGMIAYNKDLDSKKITFGDFTHDGYGDIVGLNAGGDLVLIDNSNRKFSRLSMTLDGGTPMPKHISQFRIYDMDADGRDDIVYTTAGGQLGILYGTNTLGKFTQKILDATLGITLSNAPILTGGAIKSDSTPQLDGTIGVSPSTNTGLDDSMLKGEVFYQYPHPTPVISSNVTPSTLSGVFSDIDNGSTGDRVDTFVRSQYATAYGLAIEKTYTNATHATLYPDDLIEARISIRNTSSRPIKNIEYLDVIPKIFSLEKTTKYRIKIGSTTTDRPFVPLTSSDYDMYFVGRDLAPGETMEITYDLVALPASYGEMIVGDLEKGTTGADIYGDVGFKTSTTCGASMLLWTSDTPIRTYTRGNHAFGAIDLPDGLGTRLADADNNGTPDSVENMSLTDRKKAYTDMTNARTPGAQSLMKASKNGTEFNIGFDENATNTIIDATQNLLDGLSCGFGGGSCLNSPLNWAPLAPGSSPSLFGVPLNIQGMTPSAGLPIFSALTGFQMKCGMVPCCIPTVFPVSSRGFVPGPFCGPNSAGGKLGTWAPSNFLRIYVTPTLTLGMGTAICLGGPAASMGQIPPPGLSPLIQGGNCIVMAKAMPFCKGDGSDADGNVSAVSGLGTIVDTWNATSCHPEANTTTEVEDRTLTSDIVSYLMSPDTARLNSMYTRIAKRGPLPSRGPLLQIGGASSGGSTLDIDIDSNTKVSGMGSVIKIKNKRIAAFPDFLMDWLTRQTEELTTSLFTPPNLTVIPPSSFGQNAQVDKSYDDFSKKLGASYSQANLDNIKRSMSTAFDAKNTPTAGAPGVLQSTVGATKGTLNSIKSAYSLIGKLPFISIQQSNIPLNIPWINRSELDRYSRSLEAYKAEILNFQKNLCINDPSPACLAKKASLTSGAFIGSILENLKRIEDYKRFPMKIQKYITWKERYIAQILCNINTIQQITGGWLRDNGVRFRKWAELYVLIKAIAQGWQPLLDIFSDTSKSCGVCRNERNNLQYWKFKLLSMLIPSIPVLKFPKWPDIILDLSDIRFGISISMPSFDPRISPIRLPDLPALSLGNISALLALPGLLLLPPIPSLPDLPDLPSLPRIKLPDLPPPPKIPKIAGSITAFLKIMKLISKMYCFYQNTFLIPEWQVGDIIAQRTERQGTLPFDFINLSLPQFSLPFLKEIKVGSHVNYSLRSEFISEFARTAVKPVNSFQTDLKLAIPRKIGDDVSIPSVQIIANPRLPYHIEENVHTATGIIGNLFRNLEGEKDILLEVDDFASYIMSEFNAPEFATNRMALKKELKSAGIMAQKMEKELIAYNDTRFSLLKDYIGSENDNVAHLQNIVNLLNTEVSGEPRQLIADITTTIARSTHLLEAFNTFQSTPSVTPSLQDDDVGIGHAKSALSAKLSRLIAANDPVPSPSLGAPAGIAAGYSPRYQGIYIRTPSGIQTQLFDYIAPLTDETRVDAIDIDQDGDTDYIYVLDGILYVKYSWKKLPHTIGDTSVEISEVLKNDTNPYIPDYFHENSSTPKNLNFSFVPSSTDETEWRAEFYDRYTEWDRVDIGTHDERTAPKTTIDMFLKVPSIPVSGTPLIATRTTRSLTSVQERGSFIIEGRSIDIYTGALSLSLSPGRVLYTGRDRVTISYTNQANVTSKTITLEPYTGYEFSGITEVTTPGGKLYRIGQEDGSLYTYSDDLIGLPILPGMRIYASDSGATLRNHTNGSNIVLPGGATYITHDLGDPSTLYEVSVPYVNGYYYARINNLTTKKTDRAGVILFAPQASSDDGAPIVDLPTKIRLPIYATASYKISDILTDLSHAAIMIDSNLTIDSDKNGIVDDDFATSGTGFEISNQMLTFGKFLTPGMYAMSLKAMDDIGNTTIMPLLVEAYTLIPQIQSVTKTGAILGSISQGVVDTPIHFFRIRPGDTPTLLTSIPTLAGVLGQFSTRSFFKTPEIISLKSGANIASVDSHGVFTLPPGYRIDMVAATNTAPMQLLMVNQSGSISHRHTLALPGDTVFIDASKNISQVATGVLITPTPLVSLMVPATTSDPSIPGGVYITDSAYHPLLGVARDGNLYLLDATTTLRYATKDGYMMIEVVRSGTVVASIVYRIDFFYTMK